MASKRGDLLSLGLARLKALAPHVQFIGLSATIPDPELARDWLCGPSGAIVKAPARTLPKIRILQSEKRIPWAGHMALYALPEVYAELAKSRMSIVFVNTRAQAELIFQHLWKLNAENLPLVELARHLGIPAFQGDEDDVLRRVDETSVPRYEDDRLQIEFADMRVTCVGEAVKLTRKEFDLLTMLAKRAGRIATRQQLLDEVWGYDYYGDTRTLDVHIRRLRQKLGPCDDAIETVIGVGYRFCGCQAKAVE